MGDCAVRPCRKPSVCSCSNLCLDVSMCGLETGQLSAGGAFVHAFVGRITHPAVLIAGRNSRARIWLVVVIDDAGNDLFNISQRRTLACAYDLQRVGHTLKQLCNNAACDLTNVGDNLVGVSTKPATAGLSSYCATNAKA